MTVIDGATEQRHRHRGRRAASPRALCYNPTNNKVYCANGDGDSVTVIDGATNSVIATVAAGESPYALCYNPTNNKVYCANCSRQQRDRD